MKSKSKKLLALILAVFMFATIIIPVGATGEVTSVIPGYDATVSEAAKQAVDLNKIEDIKNYATLCPSSGTLITQFKITDVEGFQVFSDLIANYDNKLNGTSVKQFSTGVGNQWYRGGGITVYLAADLDFKGAEISPIGGWYCHSTITWEMVPGFSGTFDGLGHTIDNFKITAPENWKDASEGYIGLFRALTRGATVKNLIIGSKAQISSNGQCVGSIGALVGVVNTNQGNTNIGSGKPEYNITIENVCNNATVLTDGDIGGGLVGRVVRACLTMSNCTNNGSVKPCTTVSQSDTQFGAGVGGLIGLVGSEKGALRTYEGVDNSNNVSNVSNNYYTTVTVKDSINIGDINGPQACAGGIVGYRRGHSGKTDFDVDLTIDNCINFGKIESGNMDSAGILGRDNGQNGTVVIKNCKNYGVVTATAGHTAGGILGGKLTASGYIATIKYNENNKTCQFNDNMVVSHYQTSTAVYTPEGETGDFYSVRVISMHDNLDKYVEFGYKVSISYEDTTEGTVTKTLKNPLTASTVYTSLTIEEGQTVTPKEFGYQYFSAISIDNIPVNNGDITVTVTPVIAYAAAPDTYVDGISVTFTVAASTLYAD